MPDFFTKEAAQGYDERNSKLSKISDALHFLTGLALKDLPPNARVLCAGAGTGAEILSLSKVYPGWEFTALDPSQSMLEVCRRNMENAGLLDRCEFVHGYTAGLPQGQDFDAVLSIFVGHFIKREERLNFYREMTIRLRPGGYLVNAEISFDLGSEEFPSMLKGWEAVQEKMGATAESLTNLPKILHEVLTVLPPGETEELIRRSGIATPVRFFQAFMICAWFGLKPKP
jgi:tRNA (cmo5U34)-methyltransferase